MRIALAGIVHETNTYCSRPTTAEDFIERRGEAILQLATTGVEMAGALAGCDAIAATPIPLLYAMAPPSGTIAEATYTSLKSEIIDGLARGGEVDAVLLGLHGAGVVDGIADLEGDLAHAVREVVGHDVPVAGVFDLHGNISQSMADALDLTLACRQYPHTDMAVRGLEAVRLLDRIIRGRLRPVTRVVTLPLLVPTSTTLLGPAKDVLEFCLALESRAGVVDCSWFHGFPYTDTPLVGSHFVVTTDGDEQLALSVANDAAAFLWQHRASFRPTSMSAERAVAQARQAASSGGPVVINETSDNPGGGAPGDGTHLLRAMLEADLQGASFAWIADPQSVARAHDAGVGALVDLTLGGKTDALHGRPLAVQGTVMALSDGGFKWRAVLRGLPANLGPCACVRIAGIDVVVASRPGQCFDPGPFEHLGIDVRSASIVALKSSHHFRAGFQDLASAIVTADPPGLTTHRIETFARLHKPRPMWPVDEGASWEPL